MNEQEIILHVKTRKEVDSLVDVAAREFAKVLRYKVEDDLRLVSVSMYKRSEWDTRSLIDGPHILAVFQGRMYESYDGCEQDHTDVVLPVAYVVGDRDNVKAMVMAEIERREEALRERRERDMIAAQEEAEKREKILYRKLRAKYGKLND